MLVMAVYECRCVCFYSPFPFFSFPLSSSVLFLFGDSTNGDWNRTHFVFVDAKEDDAMTTPRSAPLWSFYEADTVLRLSRCLWLAFVFNCLSDFLFFSFFLLHFPPSFSVQKSNCGCRCCNFPCSLSHSFSFALFLFLPECVSTTHVLAAVCFVCLCFFFRMVALAVILASACRDGWHCPLNCISFHPALRRGQTNSNTSLYFRRLSCFFYVCNGMLRWCSFFSFNYFEWATNEVGVACFSTADAALHLCIFFFF